MSDDSFERRLSGLRGRIEARLCDLAPAEGRAPAPLVAACRYALLTPAKRLRPLLALLAAEEFGAVRPADAAYGAALDAGCAVEMVHAASLLLDDLPCMDDAQVRRGRPAAHLVHGQDMTVLAAVALLNQAYAVLAATSLPDGVRLGLIARLTAAVGFDGLVAGQARDLRERDACESAPLHDLNRQKTAGLFIAAVEAGAIAGGAQGARLNAAGAFAARLGEAFQILDDLLDATSTAEALGKDVRQDGDKPTVVSLVGYDNARAEMRRRLDLALQELCGADRGPLARFSELVFGSNALAAA